MQNKWSQGMVNFNQGHNMSNLCKRPNDNAKHQCLSSRPWAFGQKDIRRFSLYNVSKTSDPRTGPITPKGYHFWYLRSGSSKDHIHEVWMKLTQWVHRFHFIVTDNTKHIMTDKAITIAHLEQLVLMWAKMSTKLAKKLIISHQWYFVMHNTIMPNICWPIKLFTQKKKKCKFLYEMDMQNRDNWRCFNNKVWMVFKVVCLFRSTCKNS